jgi:hypothetical protein
MNIFCCSIITRFRRGAKRADLSSDFASRSHCFFAGLVIVLLASLLPFLPTNPKRPRETFS